MYCSTVPRTAHSVIWSGQVRSMSGKVRVRSCKVRSMSGQVNRIYQTD